VSLAVDWAASPVVDWASRPRLIGLRAVGSPVVDFVCQFGGSVGCEPGGGLCCKPGSGLDCKPGR
jgi:hypothetical protein